MVQILHYITLLSLLSASSSSEYLLRRRRDDNNKSNYSTGELIVGGSEARKGEFPFFAAFVPLVQCGGSLIAPDRVLTAAHCVTRGAPRAVRIGATNRCNGEEIGVECGIVHPDFHYGDNGDLFNDLAILKLKRPSKATPIKLNDDTAYPATSGQPLTVIGYGATSEGGFVSSRLKKLGTFYETIENCQKNYPDVENGTHVCGDVDGQGDCQGDSGGPLFDQNKVQIGVVSYGYGCARESEDVYAGVAKHYDWIQEQIGSSECNVKRDSLVKFVAMDSLNLVERASAFIFGPFL